jgi:Sodium/hydrogen exchanger family
MTQHVLLGLAGIVALGGAAQWLAWRLRIPSILMLLTFDILVGPVTGLLHPDDLFGPLLPPLVSLAVAVILFEGGLSLKVRELRAIGGDLLRLTTVGALVTWLVRVRLRGVSGVARRIGAAVVFNPGRRRGGAVHGRQSAGAANGGCVDKPGAGGGCRWSRPIRRAGSVSDRSTASGLAPNSGRLRSRLAKPRYITRPSCGDGRGTSLPPPLRPSPR